jgi:tetratricopeptide (TPR) repeat protein
MVHAARIRLAGAALLAILAPVAAESSPESDALRQRAAVELYNLDRARAAATYRAAIAADPRDAAAYRGLATVLWMDISFLRGTMTVDSFLGRVSRENVPLPPPPEAITTEFRTAVDRAIALARERVKAAPRDADAHFDLGAAIGLRASYIATVEGSMSGAFRAARGAFDAHEKVLELNPSRADAGLIVGTYRYVVAALSLPLRWVAYAAGFGGGRERGLKLVADAAEYPGDNQADARIALVLIYNRERRYDDALTQLAWLRQRYPRNRLAWLETGSTLLRAKRADEAERVLTDGLQRFADDDRPRMLGEQALWEYGLGMSRAMLGRRDEAERHFKTALGLDARKWMHARAHLEMGRLRQAAGDRTAAANHFNQAKTLADADSDPLTARNANRLLSELPR